MPINTVQLFYKFERLSHATFPLRVPFLLPELFIELSPRHICCKISSFKDAQNPNSLEVEYLYNRPLPKKLETLIWCKVNKSKRLPHKHTNIPPHHQLHKSIRNLTSGRAWPSSRLLALYRLLEARLSSLFSACLHSPSPLNPRCFPTTLRPLPAALGLPGQRLEQGFASGEREGGGSSPSKAPAPGLLLPDRSRACPSGAYALPAGPGASKGAPAVGQEKGEEGKGGERRSGTQTPFYLRALVLERVQEQQLGGGIRRHLGRAAGDALPARAPALPAARGGAERASCRPQRRQRWVPAALTASQTQLGRGKTSEIVESNLPPAKSRAAVGAVSGGAVPPLSAEPSPRWASPQPAPNLGRRSGSQARCWLISAPPEKLPLQLFPCLKQTLFR